MSDEPLTIPDGASPAVGCDAAVDAATVFDIDAYRETHEYPGCYTCGPDGDEGDGLQIFPAATDRPDRYVWPWTPLRHCSAAPATCMLRWCGQVAADTAFSLAGRSSTR